MKKTILVTGAAGFIGSHLCHALKARGDTVIGLDNFNDYYSPELKEQRAMLLEETGIPIVRGDLCDAELLQQMAKQYGVTHLVHLAAQAGVRYSITNPHAYIKSNVEGFLNVLEVCRHNPDIKLTYASSSSVYGLNETVPFSEGNRTDRQASLYGATKKSNELFAATYHHLYGLHVTGLRFFTVYGPWGRPDMAYYSFTDAILNGDPIKIFNEGKLERDFTYIDDIIAGTVAAIDLGAENEVFNLGNHQPVPLMEFLGVIEDTLGKKAKIEFLPMQQGDVFKTYADITHSQKHLGYTPKTSLKEGIPKFVEWFVSK